MDNKRFTQRRKELGLTQTQLCHGICTQATLSKFERQGRTPSLAILEQLCHRLGVSVESLDESNQDINPLKVKLDSLECSVMQEDLPTAVKGLQSLDQSKIKAWPLKMDYYYLRALVDAMTNKDQLVVMEDCSPILDDLDEHHRTIYARLAYAALGICYQRHGGNERATFYFGKVDDFLSGHADAESRADHVPGEWKRRLTLMTLLADYKHSQGDYQRSHQLVDAAVQISSSHNATYWLPRLKLLDARNAKKLAKPDWQVRQLLDDALAFARLNNNQTVVVQAAALRKSVAESVE